ncbi:MAG TPA: hypothetical protein VHC44_06865 [Verrucomicrobiae bacterium]|nr:hypothetical protein [Verrucomicrobiae bacterium]
MKQNSLEIALAEFNKLQTNFAAYHSKKQVLETELRELELTVDLDDTASLNRINHLQIITRIATTRLADMEAAIPAKQAELQKTAEQFVKNEFNTKRASIQKRLEEKVRAELSAFFLDGLQLDTAVRNSKIVGSLNGTYVQVESNPLEGTLRYAARIIAVFAELEQFEKTSPHLKK